MTKEYDLVVIGGGPGGYVAAIRASQLGMQVAIVEKEKLGGTCLHKGCIPSKALLKSAEVYKQIKRANEYGIETNDTTINFLKVQERKTKIVDSLHQGIQSLMKKGRIDVFNGTGRILGPSIFSPVAGTISIEYANGEENTMIVPKNVLIATGSSIQTIEGIEIDGKYILSSDEALELEELPKSIVIVGGGAIGIEWASMLADFNVDVTIIEYADQILPSTDKEIAKEVSRLLKSKNITIFTKARMLSGSLIKNKTGITVDVEINDEVKTIESNKMLLSVGRKTNIGDIGLTNTDIVIKNRQIQTNNYYQTKESHIYAIGDVIGGMQLAHVASHEGIVAVEHMANQDPHPIEYEHIPSCIYSDPEVASVGLTEVEAIEKGLDIEIGKFPFKANGKALIEGHSDGFIKMIANKKTNDIVGIHMVGPNVTDLIGESSLAKFLDATPWEVSKAIHPHPSLTEVMGEAALAVEGLQIHG